MEKEIRVGSGGNKDGGLGGEERGMSEGFEGEERHVVGSERQQISDTSVRHAAAR